MCLSLPRPKHFVEANQNYTFFYTAPSSTFLFLHGFSVGIRKDPFEWPDLFIRFSNLYSEFYPHARIRIQGQSMISKEFFRMDDK